MSNETRQPAGVPTGGQFAATTHTEAAVALAVDAKPVHEFYSTGEGYDLTQTNDDIHDGDVLAVPREGVYGFMYQAWPVAVTETDGQFHTGQLEELLADNPQYVAAAEQAKALAKAAHDDRSTGYIVTGTDLGEPCYWSNEDGWTGDRSAATRFTEAERESSDLPLGDDVAWANGTVGLTTDGDADELAAQADDDRLIRKYDGN